MTQKHKLEHLSVSSISWTPDEDPQVADYLTSRSVRFLDIAPSQTAPWNSSNLLSGLETRREYWESRGITIRGFQSLLYGVGALNILNKDDWEPLLKHFSVVLQAAKVAGATKLVFGSPANRRRGSLSQSLANSIATEFFKRLIDAFSAQNAHLLLEANPEEYECDFVTDTHWAFDLIDAVNHPHFRANLDLGTSMIKNENVRAILSDYPDLIGYVHLSTAGLAPLAEVPNQRIIDFLQEETNHPCAIEQRRTELGLASIQSSMRWLEEC